MNKEELKAVVILRDYLLRVHNEMYKIEINYDGVKVSSTEQFIPINYIDIRVNK